MNNSAFLLITAASFTLLCACGKGDEQGESKPRQVQATTTAVARIEAGPTEKNAKELVEKAFRQSLAEATLEHEGKLYGWDHSSRGSDFLELAPTKDALVVHAEPIPLQDDDRQAGITGAYNVTLTQPFEERSKFIKSHYTLLQDSPGLLPWTTPKLTAIERQARVIYQKDAEPVIHGKMESSLKKPTLDEVFCVANLDQLPLLDAEGQQLLKEFRVQFQQHFYQDRGHYFFALYGGRPRSFLSKSEGAMEPIAYSLTETAGQHQLWLQKQPLSETQQLNGVSYFYQCYVGIRGMSRQVAFSREGKPLKLNPWGKWDAADWGDWQRRQTFSGTWYAASAKGEQLRIVTHLGLGSRIAGLFVDSNNENSPFSKLSRLVGIQFLPGSGTEIMLTTDDAAFKQPSNEVIAAATVEEIKQLLAETKYKRIDVPPEKAEDRK